MTRYVNLPNSIESSHVNHDGHVKKENKIHFCSSEAPKISTSSKLCDEISAGTLPATHAIASQENDQLSVIITTNHRPFPRLIHH